MGDSICPDSFPVGLEPPSWFHVKWNSNWNHTVFNPAGDRMTFDDLTITFNITENMENYIEIWNWLHNIITKKDADENYKFDARLMILSSHNNVVKEIKFLDIFPTNLGSVEFNSQLTDIEYAQATVTFKYTYYEIE